MSFMDHEQGKKLLLELKEVLDFHNVPFFLMQGTALGAYRDRGFVPTERDIDLGILQEKWQHKAAFVAMSLQRRGFDTECFVMPFTEIRTVVCFKYDCKADLVGMIRYQDKRFTTGPIRDYTQPPVAKPYALVHDADLIEDQQQLELFGRKFFIPRNIETYLEREYGPDWRVPADDHVSRTRVYNFLEQEGIGADYLEQQPIS